MDHQNQRGWNQGAPPDNFNAFIYAQNATLGLNRQDIAGGLSINAPEFVPKTIIPSMQMNHEWPHHQSTDPQGFPPQVFTANSRHFMNHQLHLAQPQQRPHFIPQQQSHQHQRHSHQQQQQQMHHAQAHHNHHNHQQQHFQNQSQQHFMMMNQQQQQQQQQQQHHRQDGNYQQHGHQQPRGTVQNRINFNNSRNDSLPNNDVPHKQTETEQVALDYLTEVIAKSNDNPGLFENYQKRLREMFLELSNNHFVMSNAIEIIFEHSINEQNFRYTGARLCLLMDNLDSSPESTFRNLLLMKMEYQHTEQVPYMQNDQRRVRGTTLFLAELYVQLKRPDDIRSTMDVSRYVLNSILLLLTKPGPENLKCVCQTLKLSGYDLQKDNPVEVVDAINQLNQIAEAQNMQTKRIIQSVVDLYQQSWGRKYDGECESSNAPLPVGDHVQQNYSDSPVFYGPDGKIISEEESSFLNSNIPASYPINIDEIVDDESGEYELVDEHDENEMDLEIQMAYKEFVNAGKNESRRHDND